MQDLLGRIAHNYDCVYTHYPLFSSRKLRIAEADIIGIREQRIDVFEVKCSHRPTKAHKQLRKLRSLLQNEFNDMFVQTFFFCGSSGMLEIVE